MLLTGLEVVTMVPGEAARSGSIRIRDGRIAAIGDLQPETGESVHDCRGLTAVPGFVPSEAEKETEEGSLHYCVHGTADGEFVEVEVTADGRVLEIERGEDEDDED